MSAKNVGIATTVKAEDYTHGVVHDVNMMKVQLAERCLTSVNFHCI
jgi:hypothetical protein